ncbi:MAG: hypothetical protein AB7F88_10760 [Pyrinomonadaceae bacterium]
MKNFASSLLFGTDSRLSGLIAFAIVGAIALGCTCDKKFTTSDDSPDASNTSTASNTTTSDTGGIPGDSTLQSLVKETTADFAQAIDDGDFAELHSKSSTDFQRTYTKDQMNNVFKEFIAKKKLILPSLNKADDTTAEFSPSPSLREENGLDILVLTGKFPTKPLNVKFEYEYVKRGGEWKLLKLVVNM